MYRDKAHYGNKWHKFENFGVFLYTKRQGNTKEKKQHIENVCKIGNETSIKTS